MDYPTFEEFEKQFHKIVFYQDFNGAIHEEMVDLPINANKEIFHFEHEGVNYHVNAYGQILRREPK